MSEPVAYVLMRDGEVDYDSDSGCISNTQGDTLDDGYEWVPVYAAPQPVDEKAEDRLNRSFNNPDVDERLEALAFWLDQQHYRPCILSIAAADLRSLYRRLKVECELTDALQQDYIDLHNKHEALKAQNDQLTKANEEKWAAFCSLDAKYGATCAEVERLKDDADRYRWLRNQVLGSETEEGFKLVFKPLPWPNVCLPDTSDYLDASVDAAMQEQHP
jgi:hypothetical protein